MENEMMMKILNAVNEIKESQTETNQRLERIEGDVSVLKGDVSALKSDVSVLKGDVSVLNDKYSSLDERLSNLEEDVSHIKTSVITIENETSNLKEDVSRIKTSVITIENDHGKRIGAVEDGYAVLYDISNEIRDDLKAFVSIQNDHDIQIKSLFHIIEKENEKKTS